MLWGRVWLRPRADGWAEGLAQVSFYLIICLIEPPSCCLTSLTTLCECVRVEVSEGRRDEQILPALRMANPDKPKNNDTLSNFVTCDYVCVYVRAIEGTSDQSVFSHKSRLSLTPEYMLKGLAHSNYKRNILYPVLVGIRIRSVYCYSG